MDDESRLYVGAKLEIDPDVVEKLGAGNGAIWFAAHDDGSKNRVNEDAVLEASSYGIEAGILVAGAQWMRKLFRDRNKTPDDLAAEKEAAMINRSVGALEQMLLEYIQAAREGTVESEGLDELIATVEEIRGYHRAGKLQVRDARAMAEILRSLKAFTDAMGAGSAAPGSDDFDFIRELLILQRKRIGA